MHIVRPEAVMAVWIAVTKFTAAVFAAARMAPVAATSAAESRPGRNTRPRFACPANAVLRVTQSAVPGGSDVAAPVPAVEPPVDGRMG
jgi:hypothetical protein